MQLTFKSKLHLVKPLLFSKQSGTTKNACSLAISQTAIATDWLGARKAIEKYKQRAALWNLPDTRFKSNKKYKYIQQIALIKLQS